MVADISFPAGLPDFRRRLGPTRHCHWIGGDNAFARAPTESNQWRRGSLAQSGFGGFTRQRGRDETPGGTAAKEQDL